MSKPENRRNIKITEGPTDLIMEETATFLRQGGNAIAFNNPEEFMEFVNRIGIIAVRLDQALNPPPGDDNPPAGTETPPA